MDLTKVLDSNSQKKTQNKSDPLTRGTGQPSGAVADQTRVRNHPRLPPFPNPTLVQPCVQVKQVKKNSQKNIFKNLIRAS